MDKHNKEQYEHNHDMLDKLEDISCCPERPVSSWAVSFTKAWDRKTLVLTFWEGGNRVVNDFSVKNWVNSSKTGQGIQIIFVSKCSEDLV